MQKLHTSLPSPENIPILIVSPNKDDHSAVCKILKHGDWKIVRASSIDDARERLKSGQFAVVICERDLPDGNWRDVLSGVAEAENPPAVLVVSRFADESLWADVLNQGGYDVLPKPFDRAEFTRIIGMAWRHTFNSWAHKKPVMSASYA